MTAKSPQDVDAAHFETLITQDREALIAIANRVLRNRHEAEDVVQETIAAVWQRLPMIASGKVRHYLGRAVRQNARKRKQRAREFTAIDGSVDAATSERNAPTAFMDPFDLDEAIGELPLSQRNVIRMKYYFGMTFSQIGASLSISSHTAASRCRYAIAKLKRLLTK
jgi:RNA polymerase sigma-70 factor, ECF subfamily